MKPCCILFTALIFAFNCMAQIEKPITKSDSISVKNKKQRMLSSKPLLNYKDTMMKYMMLYTGLESTDTLKQIEKFREIVKNKKNGSKLEDNELDVLFGPKNEYPDRVGGLFDFFVEKSNEKEYKELVRVYGKIYFDEYKNKLERSISNKIFAGYKTAGIEPSPNIKQ